jgi:hypothetical protein
VGAVGSGGTAPPTAATENEVSAIDWWIDKQVGVCYSLLQFVAVEAVFWSTVTIVNGLLERAEETMLHLLQ